MTEPFSLQPQDESQRKLMYVIYGLFALGFLFGGIPIIDVFFGGMPTIAGVIVAYIKRDELASTYYYDHIQFLIRTFWGAVIGMLIGMVLVFVFIGTFVIWLVGIWYMFRVIYGFIKLLDNKTVTTTGWFM